ncbi:phosphodiester glycosidase family protein [Paenibacillus sp. PAMC21692]|uniref:phosphodiester glycosidase family protein n=1 Tax=Paenibacillus sp. PAMC21692 TaxID=2762320 RepID=UPI00164E76D6|nr:phosphodiester glycosidase family protein [Paenibacillus sp. PAMC21692]QNK60426.1 phosphodiester glycosidase family protein [Paenibacillus sp. PAMC21692]
MRKQTMIITLIAIVLLTVAFIVYRLADRYLIEHFEVIVEPSTQIPSAGTSQGSDTESTSDAAELSNDEEKQTTAHWDDWSYEDETQTIQIEKVQTGSGEDKITYYVADVTFQDEANLDTAFAKNAFGTNIIEDTSTIAENNNAIFAINGDYYGFRSDGVIIRNGTLFRDEPAREGLALYSDGSLQAYAEEAISSDALLEAGVTDTFSFGPALVTEGEIAGDFSSVKIDKNFGNRSIQAANPRTGIGMVAPNRFLFVVVDGRSSESRGMTLTEFAELFQDLGAVEAYNLDGGGSSTMYFMGRVVNDPLGRGNERGVSDIIYIPKSV